MKVTPCKSMPTKHDPAPAGSLPCLPLRIRSAASAAIAAFALLLAPAAAVEQPIDFGAPTVLSLQGQRLKVLVPVASAPGDRATASSFLIRETEVPLGYEAVSAQAFTVMRPAGADYVVFQSREVVDSPQVSLVVSVAGDPRGPYRMELQVPPDEPLPR